MQPPKLVVSRLDDTTVRIEVLNRNDRSTSIFLSKYRNQEVEQIDDLVEDVEDYAVDAEWDAAILARFRELSLAIHILEDHTDETPPWWLAEPIGDTTFMNTSYNINPSWEENPVSVDLIEVDNFPFGPKSKRHYTIAL